MNKQDADTLRAAVVSFCEGRTSIKAAHALIQQRSEGALGDGPFSRTAAALAMAYAAGITEGRAQAKREREADRLATIATEFDR